MEETGREPREDDDERVSGIAGSGTSARGEDDSGSLPAPPAGDGTTTTGGVQEDGDAVSGEGKTGGVTAGAMESLD